MAIKFLNSVNADSGVLYVDADNNRVGIGTTSPSGKLHIQTDASSEFIFTGASTSGYATTFHMDNTGLDIGHNSTGRSLNLKTGNLDRLTITGAGNVGIGTTSPTRTLHVVGGDSGTGTHIAHFEGRFGVVGMYIRGDGNVGIGTTSPTQKLDVTGNIVIPQGNFLSIRRSGVDNPILWQGNGIFGSADQLYLRQPNNNNLHFQTNGGNTRMLITGAGNVGIGTTSPDTKLEVNGAIKASVAADNYAFEVENASEVGFKYRIYNDGSSPVNSNTFTTGLYHNTQENAAVHFYRGGSTTGGFMTFTTNNGSERMRLDLNGRLGIGTTDPSSILHIGGGTVPTTVLDGVLLTLGGGQYYQASDGTKTIFMGVDASDYGILGTFTNHPLGFRTNNTERVRITSSGDMGIGVTSPNDKLDVDGRIRARQGFAGTDGSAKEYFWYSNNSGNTGTIWRKIGTYNPSGQSSRIMITATGTVGYGAGTSAGKTTIIAQVNNNNLLEGSFWQENMSAKYGSVGFVSNSATSHDIYYQIGSYSEFAFEAIISDGTFTPDATTVTAPTFTHTASRKWNVNTDLNVTSSGTVGIGTTSPLGKLDVFQDGIYYTHDNAASRNWLTAANYLSYGDFAIVQSDAQGTNPYLTANSTPRLYISTVGNVGIGTTSPASKLDVNGGANSEMRLTTSGSGILQIGQFTNGAYIGTTSSDATAGVLRFGTNSAERMRIDVNGNVGIGNTDPDALLDVGVSMHQSATGADIAAGAGGANVIGLTSTLNHNWLPFTDGRNYLSAQAHTFRSADHTTDWMHIAPTGNVGIGTTTPENKLHVYGGRIVIDNVAAAQSAIQFNSAGAERSVIYRPGGSNDLQFYKSGSGDVLRITDSGLVGIGTTSPNQKLHVTGNLRLESTYPRIFLTDTDSNSDYSIINDNGTFTVYDDTNAGHRFRINSSGLIQLPAYTAGYLKSDASGNITVDADIIEDTLDSVTDRGNTTTNGITVANVATSAGGANGVRIHINSGITASNNYMNFFTSQSSGWAFNANGTGADSDSKVVITASGNVGIGVTNPLAMLDIDGNSTATNLMLRSRTGSDFANIIYTDDLGTTQLIAIGNASGDLRFNVGSGVPERMRITSSGNVGIGTTSPAVRFHAVVTNATLGQSIARFSQDNSLNNPDLSINSTTTGMEIRTGFSTGITGSFGLVASGGNSFMTLGTAGTEKVRIASNGNVGIGTTSPGAKLDVAGNLQVKNGDLGSVAGDSVKHAIIRGTRHYLDFKEVRTANGTDWMNTTYKLQMRVDSTNHQSIDFVSDSNALEHIDILTGNQQFNTRFTYDGRVGIGTSTPTARLSVTSVTSTTEPTMKIQSGTSNVYGMMTTYDAYHGFVMRGIPSAATTYGVTAGDQMSFFEYGGQFRFYKKNTTELTEIGRIDSTTSWFNSNVGIGTTSPDTKLEVNGAIKASVAADNYAFEVENASEVGFKYRIYNDGSSPVNSNTFTTGLYHNTQENSAVHFYRGGSTTGGFMTFTTNNGSERMRLDLNGNLGIGTASPTASLHIEKPGDQASSVKGIVLSSGAAGTNKFLPSITWSYGASGTPDFAKLEAQRGGGTSGRMLFSVANSSGTMTEAMRINDASNVGIGTTVPAHKLDVVSNQVIARFKSTDSSTSGFSEVLYENDAGVRLIVGSIGSGYTNSAWAGARYMYATDGDLMIKTLGSGTNLRFYTAGATNERMRIDGSGNVGIGTTSPSYKLDVNGGESRVTHAGYAGFEYHNTAGTWEVYIGTENNSGHARYNSRQGGHTWYANGSATMKLTSTGNVGIGTTSPNQKLQVVGDIELGDSNSFTANLNMLGNTAINYDGQGGSFAFANYSMYIDQNLQTMSLFSSTLRVSNGNVGIGTTSPQQKLHIKGSTSALMMLEADSDTGIAGCYYKTEDTDNTMNRTKGFFGFQGQTAFGNGYFTMWLDTVEDNGAVTASEEKFRWERDGDFHADGDVIAYSTTTPSDIRLKTDVSTIESASEKVSKLRGVEYTWSKGKLAGQREIGLIAQEVEAVVPEVVKEKELPLWDASGESYKTVDYEKLVALLIESNKEMQVEIKQLKERLDGFTK